MSKRILSTITLLTVMLSLCVFCLPASAQKTVWDGTEVKPTADSDQDGFIDITLPSHLAWVVANDGNGGEKEQGSADPGDDDHDSSPAAGA